MANENIQELKFQVGEAWKGVYSSSTAYGLANVVQDPTGLSIYRSLKSGNVGHPLSNASWWFRIIDLSSIKAESDRIAALNEAIAQDEALRVAAEELRQQHEAERVAAETQRISAEQARVNAESARATAEQQRITAEEGRVSAESARVTAEQARVLAETLRANAEDQRAANEQNRIAAEQQRIERAESDHQRVESDLADIAVYTDSLGAFDLSKHNAVDGVLATYADLSAALTALNALDSKYKYGGMSFKFVLTSDNKYVQFRLKTTSFSIDESDWEEDNTIKGISNTSADTADEIVTFTDDEDNEFARISEEESNFTNLKSNGKEVLTSDDKEDINTSIENLSGSVDEVERKTKNIDNEETESREQSVIFTDNEDNEFARIDENGIKAKDFFDENGDSIKSTSGYNTIPKIYKEEILQINNQNRNPSTGQIVGNVPLVLLQFSDLHGDSDSLRRIVDFYDYYKVHINDAIHLGDIVYDQWSNDFNFWSECGADDILNCIGNHDDNVVGGTAKTEAECYERYFQPFIDEWGVVSQGTGKCSYYKDYANQKIRLIVMDIMPIVRSESNNVSWLESVLNDVLTNHSDYSVILANHYPIPFSGSTKIANAFNSPYSSPDYSVGNCAAYISAIDTFISNGGRFICHINGHTHFDTTLYLTGNHNQWELNINCATHQQVMWNDGDRSGHTNNQDCFNIIGFDTYNKLVKVIRVGCKYDRCMNKKNIMVIHYNETGANAPEVVTYY